MLLDCLPHICEIRKRKRTADGTGGFVDTFTDVVANNVKCWQQAAGDKTIMWWAQRDVDISHNVFFSDDPGIDASNILVINGWRLDVKSYADPDDSVGLGLLWRVVTQRIERFRT